MIISRVKPEVVYSLWKLTVFKQKFTIAQNETIERLIVGLKGKPVIILPITRDNKIVMVKQYRHAADRWIWEVPGGIGEDNESLKDVVRRELEEETGYTSDRFIKIGSQLWFDPALLRITYDVYVALDCYKHNKGNRDFDELIKSVQLVSPAKLFRMVERGKIKDSKTLAVILLGRKYIEKCSD